MSDHASFEPSSAVEPSSSAEQPSSSQPAAPVPSASFDVPTETKATVTRDDVRVTLELESAPLRVGEATWATVTVKNLGPDPVKYFTDGCVIPAHVVARLGGEWVAGSPQTGIAASFKQMTLTGFVAGAPYLRMGFTSEQRVDRDDGCLDVGITSVLKAGKTIRQRAAWNAWDDVPTPSMPIELVATFPFSGRGDDLLEGIDHPIEVSLPAAIVGGEPWPWMTPAEAVDAALADALFLDWLHEQSEGTWINPTITLDPVAATWTVGLYREDLGGGRDWASTVTMEAFTGEVLSRRSE